MVRSSCKDFTSTLKWIRRLTSPLECLDQWCSFFATCSSSLREVPGPFLAYIYSVLASQPERTDPFQTQAIRKVWDTKSGPCGGLVRARMFHVCWELDACEQLAKTPHVQPSSPLVRVVYSPYIPPLLGVLTVAHIRKQTCMCFFALQPEPQVPIHV